VVVMMFIRFALKLGSAPRKEGQEMWRRVKEWTRFVTYNLGLQNRLTSRCAVPVQRMKYVTNSLIKS